MGLRTRIAIGFILLTIIVVSVVSFWAAQSLGYSVDNSDLIKLEAIKTNIERQLENQYDILNQQANECAKAITNINQNLDKDPNLNIDFLQKIKTALELDFADILHNGEYISTRETLLEGLSARNVPLSRLSVTGPLSHSGYIITSVPLQENSQSKLIFAQKPHITDIYPNAFCLMDKYGILLSNDFFQDISSEELKKYVTPNITAQTVKDETLYRIRCFNLNSDGDLLLTAYPSQKSSISRSDINVLMLRLALLEIIGFLILGYFWGKQFFSPLKELKKGIDNVAEGKWHEIPTEVTENSDEEISSVAKSFNEMVKQLTSAKENLIETQKKLVTSEKMAALGRFSGGIAHEINNPLGTILMSADMLKASIEKGLPIEEDDVTTIIEEVKRCRDIIDTLRVYTRKIEPNLINISIKQYIEEIKTYIYTECSNEKNNISFINNIEKDSIIAVDKKAMKQVIYNLVKNAEEASENNFKAEIITETSDDKCSIIIQDYGKGFKCDSEHIFEPMFTTKAQGTGLGLFICRSIVEGHHGQIWAERLEDQHKTRIVISLPSKSNTEVIN